ncbi:cyclic nucleotide-binding domain-containing protein [Mycobacterium sp. SMC-17]|uniref:cyclic nucleotide-binding domain-containing protein n=1 Tax=Mycobacterium sp. SMC-17 TaxID=3381628 RepID=UPI003875BB5C
MSFPQRHNVFREGDAGDRLYIIASGRAKVACASSHSDSLVAVLGPSDVFGELALFDPRPAHRPSPQSRRCAPRR